MDNGVRCVNHEFCEGEIYSQVDPVYCTNKCTTRTSMSFGFERLDIFDGDSECPVCLAGPGRRLRFPAGCGHSFCFECSRKIMFWDETNYHLSPVPFGCPPCPNGCQNPTRGRQCYCIEYDAVQESWQNRDRRSWQRWNDLENESIETPDPHRANQTCPLCRTKYVRTQHNYRVAGRWSSDDV